MPCHHTLKEYLLAYLEGTELRNNPKRPLFRTIGHGTGKMTRPLLPQANAYAMSRRRVAASGYRYQNQQPQLPTDRNQRISPEGGTLEKAPAMANHTSMRTTQLYDRRRDEVGLNKIERIVIWHAFLHKFSKDQVVC
jgi:hypothetical protein